MRWGSATTCIGIRRYSLGDEAAQHWAGIDATQVKNLFLRNKKGDRHYLVILGIEQAGRSAGIWSK